MDDSEKYLEQLGGKNKKENLRIIQMLRRKNRYLKIQYTVRTKKMKNRVTYMSSDTRGSIFVTIL